MTPIFAPSATRIFARLMRAICIASACLLSSNLLFTPPANAGGAPPKPVNVTTYHNDAARTGLNPNEKILTPANVNVNSFGQLFSQQVDGFVYAQPLYLSRIRMSDHHLHNVVFVATEHNSVYAFDADSNAGSLAAPLWNINLGPSVPNWDLGSGDIDVEVGITGTPVIDQPSGTLYVVAKTKEQDALGNWIYPQRLHALDVTSGAEKFGGPVLIEATVPGVGDGNDGNGNVPFNSRIQNQRAALLLSHDVLTIVWASHGDGGPYHGWVLTYDAKTLKPLEVFNTSPNAVTPGAPNFYPLAAAGIWMGGAGPAADSFGHVYLVTGNGTYDLTGSQAPSYGDSVLRLDFKGGLHVGDYFTPSDQFSLDNADADLGSGGILLLPDSVGSYNHPYLAVIIGKDGVIRLIDRNKLGRYDPTFDTNVEDSYGVGGVWGMPAYFNGNLYFGGSGDLLKAFAVYNGHVGALTSQSNTFFSFPGPTPSISANGVTNGIVWAIQTDAYSTGGASILHAYDATDLSKELYNSNQAGGRDSLTGATKFTVPTIANGKVYVGSRYQLSVFGNANFLPTPAISPADGVYPAPLGVTISDAASNATIYYTLDGSNPVPGGGSTLIYNGGVTLTAPATVKAIAAAPGFHNSGMATGNFMVGAAFGTGDGLLGAYYNDAGDGSHLQGTPAVVQVDPTINFNVNGNWNANGTSPAAGIGGSNWSAEWTGKIQALGAANYTFGINTDDGARLWINGQLLVDGWFFQAPTWYYGSIPLQAGQTYDVKIDYFQGGGGDVLQFYWSAVGLPWQPVPQSQLYSH